VNYQVPVTNLFQELYEGDTALIAAASKGQLEVHKLNAQLIITNAASIPRTRA
jgi:hypothetical protein